jgi:RNA polymerase sigma-70 factor (ECF subfamily)
VDATVIEDHQLVRRALAGSEDAYRDLLKRYERPVWSLIVRMVRDPAIAEELAQEVFLKAFQALASYDPERKFSSWIFRIAHNASIDHLRRREPQTVPLEGGADDPSSLVQRLADSATPSPEERTRRRDLGTALDAAIARLRPAYREVILLRFAQGLAYEEICEITGLPLGTVKTFLHRARKDLAELMGGAGWGPGDVV